MKITKFGRQLVLFMSIGDGSLNSHGYLTIRHCIQQKEYIEWKKKLLNRNGVKTTDIYYVDNNGYGAYEFRTQTYEFIKRYRRILYTPKKDITKKLIVKNLCPELLAIWYFDDGGLSTRRYDDGTIKSNDLMINTLLSKEENQVLINAIYEKFGVQFKQEKNHNKYRLRCGTKEARKFISIISPIVKNINCLNYKLQVKPELSKT